MNEYTAIIGTGNVAFHLSQVMAPIMPVALVSRAKSEVDWSIPVIALDELAKHLPLAVFLAVPDAKITTVSKMLADQLPPTLPVIHLSGATPLEAIDDHFLNRAVMWPIRSLKTGELVTDWRDLPLVVYAASPPATEFITTLASDLSDSVSWLDNEQRARLHLAAVFSNNFVTALYEVSYRLCAEYSIPFELLLPIIKKTALSQDGTSPATRQTGAAARRDFPTMERHLSELKDPTYRALYRQLSDLILQNGLTQHDLDLGRDAHDDLED